MTDAADLQRIADVLEAGRAADLTVEQQRAAAAALRGSSGVRLYRECRQKYFPTHTARAAAREIIRLRDRYAESAWRRDKEFDSCPPRIVGTVNECFWKIMRTSPNLIGFEMLRKHLGN